LTVNRTRFQIEDERSFQQLIDLLQRLETISAIREGMRDVEDGRTTSPDHAKAEAKRRHGVPR
jgi:hypothetical protein